MIRHLDDINAFSNTVAKEIIVNGDSDLEIDDINLAKDDAARHRVGALAENAHKVKNLDSQIAEKMIGLDFLEENKLYSGDNELSWGDRKYNTSYHRSKDWDFSYDERKKAILSTLQNTGISGSVIHGGDTLNIVYSIWEWGIRLHVAALVLQNIDTFGETNMASGKIAKMIIKMCGHDEEKCVVPLLKKISIDDFSALHTKVPLEYVDTILIKVLPSSKYYNIRNLPDTWR